MRKSSGGTESMFVNGANIGSFGHEKNYTGYLSPYFVFKEGSFTKHYYIGAQRIVSKIGNGRFDNNSGLNGNGITAGGINFAKQQSWYDKKVEEYIASLGIPPGPPDKKGIYGSPEYTGQPYPDFGSPLNESNEPPLGWPKVPVFNQPGDVPGPPIKWGDPVTNDNVEAGWGYEGTGVIEETDLYFYHPDHLGSTSYVTTRLGKVSQHVEYIPFGEVFLEEKNDKWNSPYKFNSKEMDEETGLYYYGARYYDSKVSVWLSVDKPLIDGTYLSGKHNGGVYNSSNLNGYAYCYQNPVRLIDPDGNQVDAITNGVASGGNVTNDISSSVSRPAMQSVKGIVLHRTVSSSASSAIRTAKSNEGKTGFHIVIDTDGSTTQLVNFNNRANHVGKQKIDIGNYNSIGIEVVGNYNSNTTQWDPLTPEQIESTAGAVHTIMGEYNLTISDVYPHEDLSWKTAGEGQVVLDAIKGRLDELLTPNTESQNTETNSSAISTNKNSVETVPPMKRDGILQAIYEQQQRKVTKE
ncbi:MAG: N-acetylmuramoyl-L-alanine amidase [Flavobacteriaceae bacterium]|jgi:RHS repeat-associated protein|nr:N-acetylmuramoyl-L-alanine amidase [Flavobacteriaceae bacterium]